MVDFKIKLTFLNTYVNPDNVHIAKWLDNLFVFFRTDYYQINLYIMSNFNLLISIQIVRPALIIDIEDLHL